MPGPAPIAMFVHDRPERTAAALDALRQCEMADQSRLTVFCDAPKTPEQIEGVDRVRRIARDVDGFAEVDVVLSPEHQGRSRMVFDGVTRVLEDFGRVVVLEDDLIVSPHFLRFVNHGLDAYANEDAVISVCGFAYNTGASTAETCFLPGAHCWGWATWQRSWDQMCLAPEKALDKIVERDLIYAFDAGGAEPLTQLLQASNIEDDSCWSLCWMASAIAGGKLTLHPSSSLVQHAEYSAPDASVAPVFKSPLSEDAIQVGKSLIEADKELIHAVGRSMIAWRGRKNLKVRLFSLLSELLPDRLVNVIYTAIVKRKLRHNARRRAASMPATTTNTH